MLEMLRLEVEAKEQGVSVAALLKRAQRKNEAMPRVKKQTFRAPPTLNTLGMVIDEREPWFIKANEVAERMRECRASVTRAKTALAKLHTDGLPFSAERLSGLRQRLDEAGDAVSANTPHSVCPYCKSFRKLMQHCTFCRGLGWASKAQFEATPPSLLDIDKLRVSVAGQVLAGEPYMDEVTEDFTFGGQ